MEHIVMELLFRFLSHPVHELLQDVTGTASAGETLRQFASIAGILLLAGLWLYLANHGNRRMASLTVIGLLALAYGAGYTLGKESRLETLHVGLSQLILFFELLIDLPRGLQAAGRTAVTFIVTGVVGIAVGGALATAFSSAGPVGELIVELFVVLFF
jgi:hypothetical protein